MNKIESAIHEIHHIDYMANRNTFLNNLNSLFKLIITVFYIAMLTSIDKYNLNAVLAMGVYLIIISFIGNLSIKNVLKKMKLIIGLLFLVGIANPILDRNVIFKVETIPVTTGMVSMITLFLKGVFAIIASYYLIVTTSFNKICSSLKKVHVPNIFITTLMLIYRYIVVFLKEANKIWTSYQMRAPKQKGVNYKAWGSMIGSLIIRSIDKSQTVYESMELRGFNADIYFVENEKIDIKNLMYFLLGVSLIIVLRFIPVFELVGNLFVK